MGQTDLKTGLWFPIKKMTWEYVNGEYENCVTKFTYGAQKLQDMYPDDPYLITFGGLKQVRQDQDIYHCPFANRMPVNREPRAEMLEVLGLDIDSPVDPVEYVSRSGGYRHGDSNDLFPEILASESGNYNFYFRPVSSYQFASSENLNLKRIAKGKRVKALVSEDKAKLECQGQIIGLIPGYIKELSKKYQDKLEITIAQVNEKVPPEYQFLLKASLKEEMGQPFTEMEYQAIN